MANNANSVISRAINGPDVVGVKRPTNAVPKPSELPIESPTFESSYAGPAHIGDPHRLHRPAGRSLIKFKFSARQKEVTTSRRDTASRPNTLNIIRPSHLRRGEGVLPGESCLRVGPFKSPTFWPTRRARRYCQKSSKIEGSSLRRHLHLCALNAVGSRESRRWRKTS